MEQCNPTPSVKTVVRWLISPVEHFTCCLNEVSHFYSNWHIIVALGQPCSPQSHKANPKKINGSWDQHTDYWRQWASLGPESWQCKKFFHTWSWESIAILDFLHCYFCSPWRWYQDQGATTDKSSRSPNVMQGAWQIPDVMGLGETLHLSSHKYTGPLSIVKIAKVMYCSGSSRWKVSL